MDTERGAAPQVGPVSFATANVGARATGLLARERARRC